MYQINIKGQNFAYRRLNSSVQGSVGVEQVTFSFDESWDGLVKWACFKNDNVPEIHVLLSDDNLTCDVPWEMYTKEGALYIGALGMRDGVVVKPTFWVQVSEVSEGVSTEGANPGEYTPSEIEQLTKVAKDAESIAQSVRDDMSSFLLYVKAEINKTKTAEVIDGVLYVRDPFAYAKITDGVLYSNGAFTGAEIKNATLYVQ